MFNEFHLDKSYYSLNCSNIIINNQNLNLCPIDKDYNYFNESIINSYSINTEDHLEEKEKLENIISNPQFQRQTESMNTSTFNPLMKKPKKKVEKKCGRKKKRDNSNTKSNSNSNIDSDNDPLHDKFCEDNLMRRLKANLMDSILNFLNNNLNDNSIKFQKLHKDLNVNLKKDYNLTLMKRTIRDIFYNEEISKIYINNMCSNINKKIIEKIEKEKVETKIIRILNMTFIDFINEIRDNHLDNFFIKIKEKEIKNKANNIEQYMDKLKQLFANYEKYFENKKGRKRIGKNNRFICKK